MKPVHANATEGDVEMSVVQPMLCDPDLLNIPLDDIRSKAGISARDIGKGAKKKIGYIPDFCVFKQSLPILIVEAKSPAHDTAQAYSEGRMYAMELNRSFPAGLNPCCRVIATNGIDLLAGSWDADPEVVAKVQEIAVGSATLDQLIALAGDKTLEVLCEPINHALRSKDFKRPFNKGGGASQIASHIEPNTFAADLAPALRKYFSSRDQSTDEEIYSRAYISSNEITGYDRILESFLKDRLSKAARKTEITTTKKKSEQITKTISKFVGSKTVTSDIQLITGGVGSGKSLFARRYKEFLQPEAIRNKNHWAFLNFNNAPDDHNKWNNWVCEEFSKSLIDEGAPVDLRSADDQERVFSNDLADRQPFYERMDLAQPGRGMLERARDLEQWRLEPLRLAKGLSRYLQGDKNENLIVVFDNVDRRDSETQLAAFQMALWFADQTRCLLILQLRDSTFEAFKNEPPLDTYKTGQIFHISPPRFIDVVKKRLELSIGYLAEETPETVKFKTSSGVVISYPKSRAGDFLRGVYFELFQSRSNIARVLEGLAGRDVRKALDMFMAIITSGHMPEEVIASVAQGTGFRNFPEYRILRALMRQDYRFFNNNSGFVANIFHCESGGQRPSNILIPEMLFYLISQRKVRGDNGQMGFVAMARLSQYLESLGFVRADIREAAYFCLRKELIEVETSSAEFVRERDSIKATASAWAHMRLLSARIEYLAAVLPTTPINRQEFSDRIYDVMQMENRTGKPLFSQSVRLVEGFEVYLRKQIEEMSAYSGFLGNTRTGAHYILGKVQEALTHARRENVSSTGQSDLLDY